MDKRIKIKKWIAFLLILALIPLGTVVGTLAYIKATAPAVKNTFIVEEPTITITEKFENNVKKNVSVINESPFDCYVRIKLITYRIDPETNGRIGGTAEIPIFQMGQDWAYDANHDFYYYTKKVSSGSRPSTDLIGDTGIVLQQYTDRDGGVQVVEVIGEAIQADPSDAIQEAWGITIGGN